MSRSVSVFIVILSVVFALPTLSINAAEETVVYGPEEFNGRLFNPRTTTVELQLANPYITHYLQIENGMEAELQDCSELPTRRERRRCAWRNFVNEIRAEASKAIDVEIVLNGETVVFSGDISRDTEVFEVPLAPEVLMFDNELVVTVQGLRRSFINVSIIKELPSDSCPCWDASSDPGGLNYMPEVLNNKLCNDDPTGDNFVLRGNGFSLMLIVNPTSGRQDCDFGEQRDGQSIFNSTFFQTPLTDDQYEVCRDIVLNSDIWLINCGN